MKYMIIIASLFSSIAFAEVPPPGTARKGPIVVTPEGKESSEYDLGTYKVIPRSDSRKVQRMVDGLRKKIKDLEAQLAQRPKVLATPAPIVRERLVERTVEKQTLAPVTIYAGVGAMPDGVYIDAKDKERKAQIHEFGTALQLGGLYHFDNGVSIGANGAVTTRDTHLQAYFGTLGYSFGSK